jgi:hypothetical protein
MLQNTTQVLGIVRIICKNSKLTRVKSTHFHNAKPLLALTVVVQKFCLIGRSCHLHSLLHPPICEQIYLEISYLKINDVKSWMQCELLYIILTGGSVWVFTFLCSSKEQKQTNILNGGNWQVKSNCQSFTHHSRLHGLLHCCSIVQICIT